VRPFDRLRAGCGAPHFRFSLWHTDPMHSLALGDFELGVFSDGTYPLDGGAFFGVIPKVMWSRKMPADAKNYITCGLNSLLVRTGKQTILIETGIGNKLSDRMRKFYGQPAQLLDNLSAAGIAPEDIDIVINSHLHFDHCGWNTVRDKSGKIVPTFPRAKYYAPEGEWQYARAPSERDAISYISENYDPLVENGQMTLLKGGEEVVPGISVRTFRGHTASMQGIIVQAPPGAKALSSYDANRTAEAVRHPDDDINGDVQRPDTSHVSQTRRDPSTGSGQAVGHPLLSSIPTACYISDLMPTSAHIDLTWGMGFDLYPLDTIASKKEYYARALPEKWLTVFTHDPKMPWAYIEQDAAGKMVAKEAR
jgi:glyoxylase-like metal-dependent hydrolase (beta-lactamase superfamily II)